MADQNLKPIEAKRAGAEEALATEPTERVGGIEVDESLVGDRESVEIPRAEIEASADLREADPVPEEPVAPVPRPPARVAVPAKDPALQRIEDILGEDLTDTFLGMTPERQKLFKEKGEETASMIQKIMEGAKVSTQKIFDLIRKWLKLIPGVNRFFLEQEAKIKTDKILSLRP